MAFGEHVRVKRLGYWHHGIDCGDGTVIHYSGEMSEKRDAHVRRTPVSEFTQGAPIEVVRHRHALEPEQVVARAESRLGEKRYRLLRNNCEHFARWCATGRRGSIQVQRAAAAAGGVAVTVGSVALTLGARRWLQPWRIGRRLPK